MTAQTQTAPPRFVEGDENTVIDTRRRLVWMKQDTWQATGKWLNWLQVKEFFQEMNGAKFAGYNDWRLPTQEEAKSLFDKTQSNKDHMGQKTYFPEIFPPGFGFLCWTSEVRNKVQAVRVGFRKGGAMYDDIYRISRGATRLVRSMEKKK